MFTMRRITWTDSTRRGGNSGNTTKEPFPRRFNRWYYALGYGSKLPVQKISPSPKRRYQAGPNPKVFSRSPPVGKRTAAVAALGRQPLSFAGRQFMRFKSTSLALFVALRALVLTNAITATNRAREVDLNRINCLPANDSGCLPSAATAAVRFPTGGDLLKTLGFGPAW